MTREEASKRVLDYVYGEMSVDSRREFEDLLRDDAELRAEVESITEVRRVTADLEPVHLPQDVRKALIRAARRKIAVHEGQELDIRTMIERFFLSPAFSGALVVLVSLGVGLHLILETGLDDRITRLEKNERAAARGDVAPATPTPKKTKPAEEAEAKTEATAATVSTADLATDGSRAQDGPAEARAVFHKPLAKAPSKAGKARPKRHRSRKPSSYRRPAGPVAVVDMARQGVASGEAGGDSHKAPESVYNLGIKTSGKGGGGTVGSGRAAVPPAPDSTPAVASGFAEAPTPSGDRRPSAADGGLLTRGPVSGRKAAEHTRERKARKLSLETAAPPAAESMDEDRSDGDELRTRAALLEARKRRARGDLALALTAYQRALAGDLEGQDLRDALYEAADTARKLGRTDTARQFLERLSRLPGGAARGAEMMMELDAEAEK